MKRLTIPLLVMLAVFPVAINAAEYDKSWWPTATADTAKAVTGEAVTIPVLSNDLGIQLQLRSVNTNTVGLGSASLSTDLQSVVYQSASGFTGNDTFWYDFVDSQGRANAAMVTVQVSSSEDNKPSAWPIVTNDTSITAQNTWVEIDVLSNDGGVGLTLSEVNGTTVALGKASINVARQSIEYIPPVNFVGTDEFWYVFSDKWGRKNAGKVTVSVKRVLAEAWPEAIQDTASTINTESVLVPVLENDIGEELVLTKTNATTVKLGKTAIESGQIRYTPPAGFSGEDSFWYDFEDNQGRANSTQVFVTVSANTTPSIIAFCGANYNTDGSKDGTSITSELLNTTEVAIDDVDSLNFVSPESSLAIIGERRYFVVDNGENLGVSLLLEENGVSKRLRIVPNGFTYGALGAFGETLFYGLSQENTLRVDYYAYHNDETLSLGSYFGNLVMLNNKSAAYFSYVGANSSGSQGEHFLRFDEDSQTLVEVASEFFFYRLNQNVFSLFYQNGIDYVTEFSSSSNPPITSKGITLTQTNASGELLSSQQASVEKAIISEGRLLMTTVAHTAVSNAGVSTDYPAKLLGVNASNELIELAVCE